MPTNKFTVLVASGGASIPVTDSVTEAQKKIDAALSSGKTKPKTKGSK
jgi:hypothetical protein